MTQFLSPEIRVNEFDFSQIVPAVSTSFAAFAGVFRWGPVGQRTFIDSEALLASRFGKPADFNAETWFTAANFLSYVAAPIWLVRAANTTSSNGSLGVLTAYANTAAVANAVAQLVLTEADYLNKDGTFDTDIQFLARWPGSLGNSLRTSVVYTANAYTSTLNLQTWGSSRTLSVNVGSNTGTFVINATSITTVNANAIAFAANLAVTDLLEIGNTTIGKQYMKITQVAYTPGTDATGNTTTGQATVTIHFEDDLRLHTNYSSILTLSRYWEFWHLIGKAPGQSRFVFENGNVSAQDELHLVVVDDGGKFSGVPGTVLETYKFLSRATDAKGLDNGSIYLKDVINQESQYIWWANEESLSPVANASAIASSTQYSTDTLTFTGGGDGLNEDSVALSDIARGFDLFASTEDVDISLVMTGKTFGGVNGTQLANYLIDNISEVRKDCVVFCSPEQSDVVNNLGDEAVDVLAFRNSMRSSSYGFLDSGYKYQYDKYNNVYRWIPLNGDIAGLTARTDFTRDAWWSPAGFNRGNIKNIVSLPYNPRKAERDLLYPKDINPVVSFPGAGTILFGDRTLLAIESAFTRINVRRLFIVLEKAISLMARAFLFEFNDEFTRAQFKNVIVPYLREIKARRGITDFLVRCDDTNNTPAIIDGNQFVADIFVKPNRSINFISLNFIATGTAIQFSELEGIRFS